MSQQDDLLWRRLQHANPAPTAREIPAATLNRIHARVITAQPIAIKLTWRPLTAAVAAFIALAAPTPALVALVSAPTTATPAMSSKMEPSLGAAPSADALNAESSQSQAPEMETGSSATSNDFAASTLALALGMGALAGIPTYYYARRRELRRTQNH